MVTEVVMDAVEAYYRAWSAGDEELWASLWDEHGEFHDPAGSESVFIGRDALTARFAEITALLLRISYVRHDLWACGNECAVLVRCEQRRKGDDHLYVYELVHTFDVTSTGKLRRVKSFFDEDHQQVLGTEDEGA